MHVPRRIQSSKGKNMTLTNHLRKMKLISAMASGLTIAAFLGGCGRVGTEQSTADRVKRVEERQKSDANFHVERKAGAGFPVAATANAAASPAAGTLASSQDPATAKVR